jgi:hypothetical protein
VQNLPLVNDSITPPQALSATRMVADNLDDLEDCPTFAALEREAEVAGAADPIARHEHAYLTPELTVDAATWRDGVEASAHRAGFASITEYIETVDPLPERAWPITPSVVKRTIGTRTALDLLCGAPPDQLVGPFLTPEGATIVYGKGGVGKGVLTCYLIKRLAEAGHIVLVVDFEGHEREWGSRLRGLGLTDEQLARVHYRAPFADDWTARRGSLADVAQLLRDDRLRVGATFLVVDSYSVATSSGDTMGGQAAAQEYFGALSTIGLPSVTIAHVRGDSVRFPERPFGSVFVHNLARETWVVEQLGDDEDEYDPDLVQFGPHVVALELRNKKANGRPKSRPQFVTFSFFAGGTIEVATVPPAGRSVADMAVDALAEGPLILAKIAAAIKEDTGQAVSERTIRTSLKRDPRRFV